MNGWRMKMLKLDTERVGMCFITPFIRNVPDPSTFLESKLVTLHNYIQGWRVGRGLDKFFIKSFERPLQRASIYFP